MRQDEVTLLDIAKAARLIRVFIGDMTKGVPGLLTKIEPLLPKKPAG
jgi:hypothetical protein